MKKYVKFIFYNLFLFFYSVQLWGQSPSLKLWYKSPANALAGDNFTEWKDDKEWLKGLPLGNGSLGVVVFGDVAMERIQLNEETMWSGSPQQCDNPQAPLYLEQIRKLLFSDNYKEATELTNRTQVCIGAGSGRGNGAKVPFGCFQTLGDLWIDFANKREYTEYYRELNLENAMATVTYKQGNVRFKREIFVSYPDQVMVIRLSADKGRQLSFTCCMTRPERFVTYAEDSQLVMSGALPDGTGGDGLRYMARLKAVTDGGTISCNDSTLTIDKADEAILFLTASSDYQLVYPYYKGRDYISLTKERISKAGGKNFNDLYQAHREEYSTYFNRATFNLNEASDTIATDVLVADAKAGKVNSHLYELIFQYGRYLLISSSRPGTMPANLQGIWANKLQTPWNGDYHTDVNIEMNYCLAEITNLPEMHLPIFDLITSLVKPGEKTAQVQYRKKGWVVHPITNVWGYTSPGESASWGMHTGASAWICQHIGEHYRFTGEKDFLRKMYPVLKGAVEFYMDWLVTDPKTGKLVSGPAVSPENTFVAPDGSPCQISMGPTHDQQTIWQLFDDFEMASEALQINDAFTQAVADAKGKLLETRIGSDGRIMEWAQEFPEAEPGHRHISHLFAVHPGSQINLLQTPELAEAASKSMDYRISHGGGHTGWRSAWLISQYARLHRAEKAKENLDKVLEKSLSPNLFTLCPPFQIDANFGTTAGIAEMLLQSHVYERGAYIVQLLPSLPERWKNGKFSGLKARGGFEVSVEWRNGSIVHAEIKSCLGNAYRIYYQGKYIESDTLKKGETWSWNGK